MNYGYFDLEHKEYVITRPDTPSAWSNYLGDPEYGAIITNNAAGYSFVKSGANGSIASWQPVGKPLDQYHSVCRHGTAYTVLESEYAGIKSETTYYVPDTYEVWQCKITNTSDKPRKLSVTGFIEFTNDNNYNQDQVNLQYTLFITRTSFEGGNRIIQHINENSGKDASGSNWRERFFGVVGAPVSSANGDLSAFIGPVDHVEWEEQDVPLVSKHILVTQPSMNGKTFGSLHFSSVYGVNVTRIRRNGMNLYADRNLRMQVGDKIVVVGPEDAVDRVAQMMGNSVKSLDHPNLSTIFVGILVGIIFGMMPIAIPGIPTPVKLGLAGGPLIIAILVGRFGYRAHLVAYTTTSANLMLREIGLVLFLASVGIKAGASFWDTVVAGDGLTYVWCGFLITVLPILIVGTVARLRYKLNYFTLMGLIAGSTTDPPALAYANQTAGNDAPAVGYSTVYPLSMFLRILTAQLIILLLCAA